MTVKITAGSRVEVKVQEVIFSNIGEDISATGKGGFQIIAHSRNIPEPLINLEKLLAAGPQGLPGTYFSYVPIPDSDRILIVRMGSLQRKDRIGRGGRFTCHGLIISRDEFKKIGNNPFALIDSGFSFFGEPYDLLQGKPDRLDCLPEFTTISCATTGVQGELKARKLDPAKEPLIGHLEDPRSNEEKIKAGVLGSASEIEDMLRDIIHFLKPEDRLRAFFDMSDQFNPRGRDAMIYGTSKENRGYLRGRALIYDPDQSMPVERQLGNIISSTHGR